MDRARDWEDTNWDEWVEELPELDEPLVEDPEDDVLTYDDGFKDGYDKGLHEQRDAEEEIPDLVDYIEQKRYGDFKDYSNEEE